MLRLLHTTPELQLYHGNALELIDQLPDNLIQTCITSPTYWGKRQFTDDPAEFGTESLEEYVDRNVTLYTKILQKLKPTGSLFVIMQDSYMGSGISRTQDTHWDTMKSTWRRDGFDAEKQGNTTHNTVRHDTIQYKSLCGLPFRIANALVDRKFLWRQTLFWEKDNPQPDGSEDKCMTSVEYILHFTKSPKYTYYKKWFSEYCKTEPTKTRLRHQVWRCKVIPKANHTATFPNQIVKPLLLGTSDPHDTIFEPFLGSGTMMELALRHNRKCIACDINQEFVMNMIQQEKSNLTHWFKKKNQQ